MGFPTGGRRSKRQGPGRLGPAPNLLEGGGFGLSQSRADDSFTNMESPIRWHGNGIMVVDVSDPANPKQVAIWWGPGQRTGQRAQYKGWREYGAKASFASLRRPKQVPHKVEARGQLDYCASRTSGLLHH